MKLFSIVGLDPAQIVWLLPILPAVKGLCLVMITSSVLGAQGAPVVIIHLNVFAPKARPVTRDVATVGEVTVPPPDIRLHAVVPGEGLLPASVVLVPVQIN